MQTFRVSVSGGIDAVTDLTTSDGNHVAYMENLDVRGGKAKPYNLPLINPNVIVPDSSVQVYSYRGRLLFSSKRRSYTAEFMDSRERIYWTEYGGDPSKMIEGVTVQLGTPRPSYPPIVNIGTAVSPANIEATVTVGDGALTKGTTTSFRLAYRTALGVLPASGVVMVNISSDDSKIKLSWENPVTDISILETMIFIGIAGGDEKYLTTLSAKNTTFEYATIKTASGENASLYDQQSEYQYCVTYVRNVGGVKNESGPSSPTPPYQSTLSRSINIDPWVEGILDSKNLITWSGSYPSFSLVAGSTLPGSGVENALTVSSIVYEADTGRVKCTFIEDHYFYNGERIFIAGCSPDPFNSLPVEIQVEDEEYKSVYLVVGEGFTAPGTGLTGVSAYRVYSVGVTSMGYNPESGAVEVLTATPHTFSAGKVLFSGLSDVGWNNQEIKILPDPNNASRLFVENKSLPSDVSTSVTGCSISQSLTAIVMASTTGATIPSIGDILYLDFSSTGATGAAIKDSVEVKGAPSKTLLVNAALPGATAAGGPSYTDGIQFVPKNDYITHRRLYRAGGTEYFQLVKEIPIADTSFLDAIPDAGLGEVLPTLFTKNDVDVVVEPAPFGMDGLVQHYGMGFAWQPSSNRLRWTLTNNMDAWPPEFYRDFDHRILAMASFDQALCVFCEDGIYRMDGTDPTLLMRHRTKAAPCRAGGSVQFLNNSIVYLSDQGLMAFNGQTSTCLTDLKIPGDFWLANSRYLDGSEPGCYLVPFTQNAAYERLRGADLPSVTPRCLMPYLVQHVNQRGIRSFVRYGKYYLYWGADFSEYAAQTMICIDFSAPGAPLTVIGVKAVDAFVDEVERVHMILEYPQHLE